MSCACTAVMRTKFSVSAKCALSCASWAWRCAYCRFLFDEVEGLGPEAEEAAREEGLLLVVDILGVGRAVSVAARS